MDITAEQRGRTFFTMTTLLKRIGEYEKAKTLADQQSSIIYCKELLLSLVNLFETVFSDGRCGNQHGNIRYIYLHLADYEAKYGDDLQKALEYFDKGFEHHKTYCNIYNAGEYSYSAPALCGDFCI